MKKLYVLAVFAAFLFTMLNITACSDDDDDDNTPFIATQANLNAATNVVELDINDNKYGESTIPHNGNPGSGEDTFRDVFSSESDHSNSELDKGTIVIKHTYAKNADGTKGDLLVTFAMIKREADYYPTGGDWEYVMMPNDGSNDYSTNVNGLLPSDIDDASRGKLASCAGCHAEGGTDFLFVGR